MPDRHPVEAMAPRISQLQGAHAREATLLAAGCPASFDAGSTPIVRKTSRSRRGHAFTHPVERWPSTEAGQGRTGRTLPADGRHASPPRTKTVAPSYEEGHPLAWSASLTRKTCVMHLRATRLRREIVARPRGRTKALSRTPRITHPGDALRSARDARLPPRRTSSCARTYVIARAEGRDPSTLCRAPIPSRKRVFGRAPCFLPTEEQRLPTL